MPPCPRRPSLRFAVVVTLTFGACHFGEPQPEPLVGQAPALVAIWPHVSGADGRRDVDWLAGLGVALRRRGYGVVAPRVAQSLLRDAGLDDVQPSAAAAAALRADAVLELYVRAFDAGGDGGGLQHAQWDLEWRLVSQHGEGVQWRHDHHGTWRAADRAPQNALTRGEQIDSDAIPPIVPIGGNGGPGFRDVTELMSFLHRDAMQFLPVRAPDTP
ncbi:MAG: hypothetical protein R3F29_08455 [Planctomycetota bacterium]